MPSPGPWQQPKLLTPQERSRGLWTAWAHRPSRRSAAEYLRRAQRPPPPPTHPHGQQLNPTSPGGSPNDTAWRPGPRRHSKGPQPQPCVPRRRSASSPTPPHPPRTPKSQPTEPGLWPRGPGRAVRVSAHVCKPSKAQEGGQHRPRSEKIAPGQGRGATARRKGRPHATA